MDADRIEAELEKIRVAIAGQPQETTPHWHELYAAQQALMWARGDWVASPYNTVMEIYEPRLISGAGPEEAHRPAPQ